MGEEMRIEEASIGESLVDTLPGEEAEEASQPTDEADNADDTPDDDSLDSSDSPDSLNGVSDELISEMHRAFNYWHTHGYPEKASVLWECIQQKRRPPANLLPSNLTGINPETTIDPSSLEVPPRTGRNATHLIWREFAKKVIDMEPEIVDTLERGDIIGILEDKGVIEKRSEAAEK